MIKNFFNKNWKKILMILVVFCSGIVSFVGYIHSNSGMNILLLVYAYINPFFSIISLFGQGIGLIICSILATKYGLLQGKLDYVTVIYILVFNMFLIFIYSLYFKKIINNWSFSKIIKMFIGICILLIVLQFITVIGLNIFQFIPKNINIKDKFLFFKKILPLIKYSIMNYKFTNFTELIMNNIMIGGRNMFLNIMLFVYSAIASWFLAMLYKDPNNSAFNKFNRFYMPPISNSYKILVVGSFVSVLVFWFLNLHFFAALCFTFCISLFFVFFLIGQQILYNIFLYFTTNMLFFWLALMLCQEFIPYFAYMLVILGIVESIFNLRKN